MAISPKAIQLIDQALNPLIESGCRIEQIKMVVAAGSEIAEQRFVQTKFGTLRVEPNNFVPRGRAYLIEDHNRGFNWVR
ncbi:hypothetical protein AK95_14750 [Paenibacillus sp. LC231]|uniref:hypothetical protein n=1 Tax=Paenibacillus sp. LC231 TaxID=1120679 RepID=UPI0008DD42BB|nr:hypothetical protein [Paenibacillus sp. LC231]OIB04870.1 hypothetical protein AK95_14750 [Paenibacillus sp. LC231]